MTPDIAYTPSGHEKPSVLSGHKKRILRSTGSLFILTICHLPPESILPDTVWEQNGAYSGCGVPYGDKLRLYYTGNVKHAGPYDYIHTGRESNTLLTTTTDGIHVGPKQRLMASVDYPADCSLHVRDPKVWREGNRW